MSTKATLTVTLPDGTVATRTTARTYTHAVITSADGYWGVIAWCGRYDLAQKQLEHFTRINAGFVADGRPEEGFPGLAIAEVADPRLADPAVEAAEAPEAPAGLAAEDLDLWIAAAASHPAGTAAAARAELARRAWNRRAKAIGEARLEAASEWAFTAAGPDLKDLAG